MRGDYGAPGSSLRNIARASETPAAAERELLLLFDVKELLATGPEASVPLSPA